jgi:hypothetical protein
MEKETSILEVVISFIRFVISFKKHLMLGSTLGIAVGLSIFMFGSKSYESRLTAYSVNLTAEEITDLINELALAVKERDYSLIQKMTGIPLTSTKKILSVRCSPQLDVESDNFEVKEKPHEVFVVTAICSDKDFLDSLQIGIVNYINNNTFVRQRIETAKTETKQNIVEIDKEVADLRKLKENLNNLVYTTGRGSNLFLSDLSVTSSKIVDLTEKRNLMSRELELMKEINVIKDFVKFTKQSSPRLLISVVSSFLIFNLIMLLVFFWQSIRHRI